MHIHADKQEMCRPSIIPQPIIGHVATSTGINWCIYPETTTVGVPDTSGLLT